MGKNVACFSTGLSFSSTSQIEVSGNSIQQFFQFRSSLCLLPASQFSNCKFTQHQQAVQSISLQPSFNLTFLQTEFTLENIEFIASELWTKLNHYKIWAFDAEMGAGKTTLIHALCNVLKVADTVGSPTFSIINQYQTQSGNAIFHLDLYRIKDEEEAIHAGVEDVLYSGDLCLVEWPGKINSLLPADTVFIKIDILNSNTRRITIQYPN